MRKYKVHKLHLRHIQQILISFLKYRDSTQRQLKISAFHSKTLSRAKENPVLLVQISVLSLYSITRPQRNLMHQMSWDSVCLQIRLLCLTLDLFCAPGPGAGNCKQTLLLKGKCLNLRPRPPTHVSVHVMSSIARVIIIPGLI